MHAKAFARTRQSRQVKRHVSNSNAYSFFNLLTGPQVFEQVESLLPERGKRGRAKARCGRDEGMQYAYRGLLPSASAPASGDDAHTGTLHRAMDQGPCAASLVLAWPSGTPGRRHDSRVA
jgi:hypothetical protein